MLPNTHSHLAVLILHMYNIYNESDERQKIDCRQQVQYNFSHHQPSPQIPAFRRIRTPSARESTLPNIVPNNSFFSSVALHFSFLPIVTTVAVLSKFCFVGEEKPKSISAHRNLVEINCDFGREWEWEFAKATNCCYDHEDIEHPNQLPLGLWGI